MAKYIGLISSDARGKIGGIVLSRSRAGTTIKAKTVPKAPTSIGQRSAQLAITAGIGSWRSLSTANQTTWSVRAATITWSNSLGGTYSPTGQQLYMQAWLNAGLQLSTPPAAFPSDYVAPQPVTGIDLALDDDLLAVIITGTSGSYTNCWNLFLTRPLAPSILYTSHLARRWMGSAYNSDTVYAEVKFLAAYGALPKAGQNLGVRIVPMASSAFISGTIFQAPIQVTD